MVPSVVYSTSSPVSATWMMMIEFALAADDNCNVARFTRITVFSRV